VSVGTDTKRNGVDTEKMFATLDLIEAQPELAKFQFRATNSWIDGAHNRSTVKGFYGAGAAKRFNSTPVSRRFCWGATPARIRSSTFCTRWPRA
jgi:hypothetical protein